MSKYIMAGLGTLLAASLFLNMCQNKQIRNLEIVKAAQERAIAGYQINAKRYKAWRDIDAASSDKIKKVVGGTVNNTINTLNELFGKVPAVPPATGNPKPAKPTGN